MYLYGFGVFCMISSERGDLPKFRESYTGIIIIFFLKKKVA